MKRLSKKEMAGLLVIFAGAGVTGRSRSDSPRSHEIAISEMGFDPVRASIGVGDTVIWINRDPVPHNVSLVDGSFESTAMGEGEEVRLLLDAAGAFAYRCRYHPFMEGVLEVER